MKNLILRNTLLAALVIPAAGCSVVETEAERSYATSGRWHQPAAFTTADVRVITQRMHPVLHTDVVCTEPSPDVAKALTSSGSLTGKGGNGAVTAEIGASAASAEALAELAGRSTALLGLRDSLFQTCQAYANGSIGQDAYAIVLSRYSQLMATLFIAEDVATASGAKARATATLAAQSPPAPSGGSAPDEPSSPTPNKSSPSTGNKTAAVEPVAGQATVRMVSSTTPARESGLQFVSARSKPAAKAPGADRGSAVAVAHPTDPASGAPAAGGGEDDAQALVQIAASYLHPSYMGVLLVACIDTNDPSRLSAGGTNAFLARLCPQLDVKTLADAESAGSAVAVAAGGTHQAAARVAESPHRRAVAAAHLRDGT